MDMNVVFENTPLDIVIQIVEYSGIIKYRNGKFINQILKNDKRVEMLQNISMFEAIFLYPHSTKPIHYVRDLGKYYVKLNIITLENTTKYQYIFQRKREKKDTSCITLYYHKLI